MGDSAMSLLKEEFKDVDIRSKKRATERLQIVAKSLGPDRTKKELLPWLTEHVGAGSEDDEVLYLIAEQLGLMMDNVGGSKNAHTLLDPLEALCRVEETLVRNKAVESTLKLASTAKKDNMDTALVTMVQRLAGGDWFTPRVSACALICEVMKRGISSDQKGALQETYAKLVGDDTPMVRRAAAKVIHKFAKNLDASKLVSDVYPLFKSLSKDNQDTVRLNAIEKCGDYAKLLSDSEMVETLCPSIISFSRDRSWRVRYTVAKQYDVLAPKTGKKLSDTLLPVFIELLRDPEGEVRRTAAKHIPTFAELLAADAFTDSLMPIVKELVEADSQYIVRVVMADVCVRLLSKVSSGVAKSAVKPLLDQFLREGNSPEIKLVVLDGLDKITTVLGAELVLNTKEGWGKTLVTIYEGSKAKAVQDANNGMDDVEYPQWRLRRAIIQNLDNLAKGADKAGDNIVIDVWVKALSDDVKEVRSAAAAAFGKLCAPGSNFGKDKAIKSLLPPLNDLYTKSKSGSGRSSNFVHRIVFLHSFKAVSKIPDVWKLMIDKVEECLKDPVTNVKIGALKALAESMSNLGGKNVEHFKSKLQTLSKDADKDVSFWAQQALIGDVL